MRIAFAFAALLSLGVGAMVFPAVDEIRRASSRREAAAFSIRQSEYMADERKRASEDEAVRAYERDLVHLVVQGVSIAFFWPVAGLLIWRIRRHRRRWIGTILLSLVSCGSIFSGAWALILSPGARFDEVGPAWILASLVVGVTSLTLAILRSPPSAAPSVKSRVEIVGMADGHPSRNFE